MNWGAILRVFVPKLIGAGAGLASGYIYAHTKGAIQLDPEQIANLAVIMMGSATVTGKLAEWKLNPSGSAAPALVTEGIAKNEEIKIENKLNDLSEGAKEDWSKKP